MFGRYVFGFEYGLGAIPFCGGRPAEGGALREGGSRRFEEREGSSTFLSARCGGLYAISARWQRLAT